METIEVSYLPTLNNIYTYSMTICWWSDLAFDEELLFGQLNITICRLQGVTDTKGKASYVKLKVIK